jgi:hypothetical protein
LAYAEVDFNAWIRRYHPSGDHAGQLVCFPRAGGPASYYRPLSTRSQSSCRGLATSRRCSSGTAWRHPRLRGRLAAGRKRPQGRLSASSPPAGGPTGIARCEKVHQRDDAGLIAEIRHLDGTESALLENDEILRMSLPLSALSSGEVRQGHRVPACRRGAAGAGVSLVWSRMLTPPYAAADPGRPPSRRQPGEADIAHGQTYTGAAHAIIHTIQKS